MVDSTLKYYCFTVGAALWISYLFMDCNSRSGVAAGVHAVFMGYVFILPWWPGRAYTENNKDNDK